MTANQIAYQNYLENRRANQAKEAENIRHNQASEYNQLIGNLDNIFSLGAHAAKGSSNINEGLQNQFASAFGEKSPVTSIFSSISDSLTSNSAKPFLNTVKDALYPLYGAPVEKIAKSEFWQNLKDKASEVKDNIVGKITSIFGN